MTSIDSTQPQTRTEDLLEIQRVTHAYARGLDQFHIITNHVIDVDGDGETARGTNYVFSEGHTKAGAAFKAAALNEDVYRRTAGGRRIASRRISPLTPPELEGFDA